MRSSWLEFVRRVRVRENRGKKSCTYREAMKIASMTWPKEKKKIERKLKREKKVCQESKKTRRSLSTPPSKKNDSHSVENEKTVDV